MVCGTDNITRNIHDILPTLKFNFKQSYMKTFIQLVKYTNNRLYLSMDKIEM